MNLYEHSIVVLLLIVIKLSLAADEDGLDDFPLDEEQSQKYSDNAEQPDGGDTSAFSSTDMDAGNDDNHNAPADGISTLGEENSVDRVDSESSLLSADRNVEVFNKIMTGVLQKPGAKQRLAQVLPIIRSMSATQKLALATIVMNQLMGKSVQSLASAFDNKTSELMLPISLDIASMFHGLGKEHFQSGRSNMFGGFQYGSFPNGGFRQVPQSPPSAYGTRRLQHAINGKRRDDVPPEMMPPPPSNDSYADYINVQASSTDSPNERKTVPKEPSDNSADCTLLTKDVCAEITSYPDIEILESISNVEYKHMFSALTDDTNKLVASDVNVIDPQQTNNRRQEKDESLYNAKVCKSMVKYIRPKRARSMNGQWKYIVNTAEYAQTVRLEICQNAEKSCSYLAENLNSKCVQMFNYHRLLTWDQTNGLSLDIFKVPTCCSCQIEGGANPLFSTVKSTVIKNTTPRLDSSVQENTVIVDESSLNQPPPLKPNRIRNGMNQQFSTPKRELIAKIRKPSVHQQFLEQQSYQQMQGSESHPHIRYSPIDAAIRKSMSKSSNQRIGLDDQESTTRIRNDNAIYPEGAVLNPLPSANKINYNYHPIINFFKSAVPTTSNQPAQNVNDRIDVPMNNWMPIASNG